MGLGAKGYQYEDKGKGRETDTINAKMEDSAISGTSLNDRMLVMSKSPDGRVKTLEQH